MTYAVLLADGDLDIFEVLRKPGSAWVEIAIVLGIMFVVVFLVFVWAAFWRTPRKRRHSYHHQPAPADGSTVGLPRRRKRRPKWLRLLRRHNRRRRRRRSRDRRANPTLAQIGGLPPQRREPPPGP